MVRQRGELPFCAACRWCWPGTTAAARCACPLPGALKAPDSANISGWFPQDNLIQGLSTIQGVTQYISPGLGVSDAYPIPLRMFNTPSITILTLTSVLKF